MPPEAIASLRRSLNCTTVPGMVRGPLHALPFAEEAVIDSLELSGSASIRLQELGFVPGSRIAAARSAPGGDPRVYRVDGTEIALRRETARNVVVLRSAS